MLARQVASWGGPSRDATLELAAMDIETKYIDLIMEGATEILQDLAPSEDFVREAQQLLANPTYVKLKKRFR